MIKASRIFWGGLVGSVISFGFLATHSDVFAMRPLEMRHASKIFYDSQSKASHPFEATGTADDSVSALEIDPETGLIRDLKARDLHIAMTFEARSLENYPNLFQTAPSNSGLRLEFTSETAAIIAASSAPGGIEAIFISTDCKPGVSHTFDLMVDRRNRVVVKLDGVTKIDAVYPELSYEISDIVIGSGFSKQRPFVGRITRADFSYGIYKINPHADALRIDLISLALMLAATCAYFLAGEQGRAQIRWISLSAPWQKRPPPAFLRIGPHTSQTGAARRYVWPLPDDGAAELLLDRREVTFRALDFLAQQLDRYSTNPPRRDALSNETIVEYALELPGGVGATVRVASAANILNASFRRLATNVRELAGFVEP